MLAVKKRNVTRKFKINMHSNMANLNLDQDVAYIRQKTDISAQSGQILSL